MLRMYIYYKLLTSVEYEVAVVDKAHSCYSQNSVTKPLTYRGHTTENTSELLRKIIAITISRF